ncbi:MAG: type 1 glutamine amidotransferase [Actinomycetes bacterium]
MTKSAPRVLAVQNDPEAPPSRVGKWIAERSVIVETVRPYLGDAVPSTLDGYDGLLVLGGAIGALDDHIGTWLPQVRSLVSHSVDADRPVFGICLGLQIISAACGGTVELGDTPELGVCWIDITDDGREDAVMGKLPMRAQVPQMHRDGVLRPPPGATVLATSLSYPVQAFRIGTRVYGVQGHPEVDASVMVRWGDESEADILEGAGKSLEEAVEELSASEVAIEDSWRPVFHAWADLVVEYAGG